MTKNNQKIIIILILILLIFTSIMAIFISLNIKDTDNDSNTPNSNISSSEPVINKEISRLKDATEYFAVQNTLNNIFANIDNSSKLLTFFDNDYIYNNNLTKDNVLEVLKINEENLNIVVEEVYYNDNSDITYYFIKSYIMGYAMDDDVTYSSDKYYLLIVDENKQFILKPLENISNLEEFANNYEIKEVTINNDSKFKKNEVTEDNKLTTYITSFTNLMYLDTNKAYEMLDDNTKKEYLNLNNFKNNIDDISKSLFTTFRATYTKENEDNIVYKVQNHNGDTITITEYYPNDYKIGFNFIEGE